jgi:hypothetical protein
MRWDLPGKEFHLKIFREGKPFVDTRLKAKEFCLEAQSGLAYAWSVESLDQRGRLDSEFRLDTTFAFQRDARDGAPSRAGSNGPSIDIELYRDQLGVNLKVSCAREYQHFLLADASVPFLISARGGNGGNGTDGRFVPEQQILTRGKDGGDAGWGGCVRIRTRDLPWRAYLLIDVSPGEPGLGGSAPPVNDPIWEKACGKPGRPGRLGSISTEVLP